MTDTTVCWTQTASGKAFDYFDTDPCSIDIFDIAYSLSGMSRYHGHSRPRINVAQHSVMCAWVAPPDLKFEALMHDAHEAYMGDIGWPFKQAVKELCKDLEVPNPLEQMETRLRCAVAGRFGLQKIIPAGVREIDMRMLETERRWAMVKPPRPWASVNALPYKMRMHAWSPERAEAEFLSAFTMLEP